MSVMLLEKTVMDSKEAYLQCLEKLIWALNRLKSEVEPTELGRIAELIVQPMTELVSASRTS